jgi:hypothetical protein
MQVFFEFSFDNKFCSCQTYVTSTLKIIGKIICLKSHNNHLTESKRDVNSALHLLAIYIPR